MREALKSVPNLVTLGNLLCGLIGIERLFAGELLTAFVLVLVAAVLDFLDGFLARLLKADGEMGKQLDSLADLVTFGVLPGLIFYHYMMFYGYCYPNGFCTSRYAWLVIPAGAAWRLARFNASAPSLKGFVGVPVPIAGIALSSIALSLTEIQGWEPGILRPILSNFYFLSMAPVLVAWLMVSELPMMAMKFYAGDEQKPWKLALVVAVVLVIAIFQRDAGIPVLLVYVLLSLLANFANTKQQHG
jgi:CDP-diacylglycerol--serine O-phosphatidyltransferase